jgi:hypothetical protein
MAMVDEKWGRNQQVAAYDSSYNQPAPYNQSEALQGRGEGHVTAAA